MNTTTRTSSSSIGAPTPNNTIFLGDSIRDYVTLSTDFGTCTPPTSPPQNIPFTIYKTTCSSTVKVCVDWPHVVDAGAE